jgi:hypothetical protein
MAPIPPLQVLDGPIIQAGESVSDALDTGVLHPVRITMPAEWDSAVISFIVSTDGINYYDLYHSNGSPVTVTVVPGATMVVPTDTARSIRHLKIRSGNPGSPVIQQKTRVFRIVVVEPGADITSPE